MLNVGIFDVARRIADLIGVGPGKSHVPDTKPIEIAENADVPLNGMPAFEAHQGSEFLVRAGACAHNIVGAKGKDHLVRMSPYLLMYRVNQIQCAMGVVTGTGL